MEDFSLEVLVLKPLLLMVLEMLKWSLQLLPNVGSDFFSLNIVQQVLAFFQYLMYAMFVIGSILAMIDFVSAYLDGDNPNVMMTIKSILKGLIAALFMQKLLLLAYETIYMLGRKLYIFDSAINEVFSHEKLAKIFHFQVENKLISLIVVITLIFLILSITFQLLERNGLFLLYQCTSVFLIISICRGCETSFSSWIRQGIILCFMNFLQMLFFVAACAFLQQPETAFVALGLMLSSYKIERITLFVPILNRISSKHYAVVQTAKSTFNRSLQ